MKKIIQKLIKSKVGKLILVALVSDIFTVIREENKVQLHSTITIGEAINKIEKTVIDKISS